MAGIILTLHMASYSPRTCLGSACHPRVHAAAIKFMPLYSSSHWAYLCIFIVACGAYIHVGSEYRCISNDDPPHHGQGAGRRSHPATRTYAPSGAQLPISHICNSSTVHVPRFSPSPPLAVIGSGNAAKEKGMPPAAPPRR